MKKISTTVALAVALSASASLATDINTNNHQLNDDVKQYAFNVGIGHKYYEAGFGIAETEHEIGYRLDWNKFEHDTKVSLSIVPLSNKQMFEVSYGAFVPYVGIQHNIYYDNQQVSYMYRHPTDPHLDKMVNETISEKKNKTRPFMGFGFVESNGFVIAKASMADSKNYGCELTTSLPALFTFMPDKTELGFKHEKLEDTEYNKVFVRFSF